MKALSGYAEWFWLIAKNWKDVENRNWSLPHEIVMGLPYRIYLHASKTKTPEDEIEFIYDHLSVEQFNEFIQVEWEKYRGHIIGEVTIIGEMHKNEVPKDAPVSPWFFGDYGFFCREGALYDTPIPYKGRLGFFEVYPAQSYSPKLGVVIKREL